MLKANRLVRIGQCNIKLACRQFSSKEDSKTAFYDLHQELGGSMVSFADYQLPVQVNECKYLNCGITHTIYIRCKG